MTGRDELESLLGAYALDALSLEELRRVEAALAADPALAGAAAADSAVAAALAEALVDPSDRPSAALWKRIAAATEPGAAQPARGASPWRRRLAALASAAAVVVAVALGVVVARQVGELRRLHNDPLAAAAQEAREQAGTRVIALEGQMAAEVVLAADGTGYLLTSEAPPLPDDETYQLWAIVGDRVISAGVLGPAPEVTAFHVSGEIAGFALTVEVAGGVVTSEQEPVAVGLLAG